MAAVAVAVPAAWCAEPATQHYELKVNDFTELKVIDNLNVIYSYVPDSVGLAVFDAPADRASVIMFVPSGGELSIQVSSESPKEGLPTVRVYSSYLSRVENDGTGVVTVNSVQPGAKFKAMLQGNGRLVARNLKFGTVEGQIFTGNGSLVLAGSCDFAKISNTGTGQIEADELVAGEVKCSVYGTGSVGVDAQRQLSISGAGTGTVYYKGNPSIKNRSVGLKTAVMQN